MAEITSREPRGLSRPPPPGPGCFFQRGRQRLDGRAAVQDQQTIRIGDGVLGTERCRRGAGRQGQQCRRERRGHTPGRRETRDLNDVERRADGGKHGRRLCAELAAEAMIRVVHRSAVMVVVGVGTRLVRRMGKDPPAGFFAGAGLARLCPMLGIEVDLVERWSHDPGEVEHQEQRCSVSQPGRPSGLKISAIHATKPAADPRCRSPPRSPSPIRRKPHSPIRRKRDAHSGRSPEISDPLPRMRCCRK